VRTEERFAKRALGRAKEAGMEWVVAVAVSVGFGVLAGWVYGGLPVGTENK
jgi:hypothetical protein